MERMMAAGDAAAAAGMDVVAGTADLRNAYVEENKGRDYLAAHQTAGTHDAAAIKTGVLDIARIPAIPQSKLPVTWSAPVAAGGAYVAGGNFFAAGFVEAQGELRSIGPTSVGSNLNVAGTIVNPTAYGSVVSSGRTLAVRADGTFGYFPSARRFKKNFKAANIDPDALLDDRLEPQQFDWKVEYGGGHDYGFPAEDVAAVFPFLGYDGDADGTVDGYDKAGLVIPLIATVRRLAERIAALEAKQVDQ